MRMQLRHITCVLSVALVLCAGGCTTHASQAQSDASSQSNVVQDVQSSNQESTSNQDTSNISDPSTSSSTINQNPTQEQTPTTLHAGSATYDFCARVQPLYQYDLEGGCECVSLTCMLNACGFDIDMFTLVDNYLDYGDSFVYTYSGDPYTYGAGYPPVMCACANAYVQSVASPWCMIDTTTVSLDRLIDNNIARGIPVLVWTTMDQLPVDHTGIFEDTYEWYNNEHCVVLYGASATTVSIMDPLQGCIECARAQFASIFDDCGRMSLSWA